MHINDLRMLKITVKHGKLHSMHYFRFENLFLNLRVLK